MKYKYFITLVMILLSITAKLNAQSLTWIGTLSGNWSEAYAVSADGSFVVGRASDANGNPHAFRWTATTGIQDIGTLGGDWSESTDISADGSVIVGWSYDSTSIFRVFKWTAATGMQDIGAGDYSKTSAVSSDGNVILVNKDLIAYRWTATGGLEDIGNLGGSTGANDINSDGTIITGYSNNGFGDPYAFR